jgi:hypothetical protein
MHLIRISLHNVCIVNWPDLEHILKNLTKFACFSDRSPRYFRVCSNMWISFTLQVMKNGHIATVTLFQSNM